MEFWGVEVKAGKPLHVAPQDGDLIHISQVALGEVKNVKSANSVSVRLTVDDKEFFIGTLSAEKAPQIMFDLVIEKDFTLSHSWKDGSLYFCGYTAAAEQEDDMEQFGNDFSDEDESEDEEIIEKVKPVADVQAAVPAKSKAAATKPETSAKPKVTLVDPKKEDSDDSDDSEEDSDESEDDDSDDDMSEDEETPKKVKSSKKRPSGSEIKTPVSTKKSKTETPKKTDVKKGAHTATPHPAKKSEKKAAETPKSSAQVSCNSCSKTFNSEKGLESHTKAKHSGK